MAINQAENPHGPLPSGVSLVSKFLSLKFIVNFVDCYYMRVIVGKTNWVLKGFSIYHDLMSLTNLLNHKYLKNDVRYGQNIKLPFIIIAIHNYCHS